MTDIETIKSDIKEIDSYIKHLVEIIEAFQVKLMEHDEDIEDLKFNCGGYKYSDKGKRDVK